MIEKHSLTLQKHRTSVSMEPEFWAEFQRIASERGMAINALATEIDNARNPKDGLASSIRIYILNVLKNT